MLCGGPLSALFIPSSLSLPYSATVGLHDQKTMFCPKARLFYPELVKPHGGVMPRRGFVECAWRATLLLQLPYD